MMKNKKLFKLLTVLFFGVLVATGCSCTNSMCTEKDLANIKTQIEANNINDWREKFSQVEGGVTYPNEFITYYEAYDDEGTLSMAELAKLIESENPGVDYTNEANEGYIATRTAQFQEYVNSKVNEIFAKHPQACLTVSGEKDPVTGAQLEAKTWGHAWKTGLLEGLIVYPFSWLLSTFTNLLGGDGIAQVVSIVFVVFVVRIGMLVLGFKGQLSQIRMQEIQPELQALQAKFNDPKATPEEKQRVSTKMMSLYKDNNINPFSSFLTMFIQFPIFIAVWAAMNQTVAIRSGSLLGLEFGTPLNEQILVGNISAIVLFVLMIGGQVLTMKLPNIIRWVKEKKNPTPNYKKVSGEDNTQKTMNTMMIMMIALVVLSAFVLPAALVIYWVAGSLVSIIQTTVFSLDVIKGKLKSLSNRKKKAKVVR